MSYYTARKSDFIPAKRAGPAPPKPAGEKPAEPAQPKSARVLRYEAMGCTEHHRRILRKIAERRDAADQWAQ